MISVPLATHSCELFANGYQHKLELPHEKRIDLSLRGLNSFLKIPRDFFNVTISRMSDCQSALVLQHIRSAAVAGILEGFSHVRFGDEEGTDVLSRRLDDWMAFVVLLIPRHAESIISVVKKGAVLNGLRRGVLYQYWMHLRCCLNRQTRQVFAAGVPNVMIQNISASTSMYLSRKQAFYESVFFWHPIRRPKPSSTMIGTS